MSGASPSKPPSARGKFIALEGPEGCGKSTQAALLCRWLESLGKTVRLTREPGGTALGQTIRTALLEPGQPPVSSRAELLLFLADRAQHVREVILPALEAGHWVVTDRFSMSTLAYQGIAGGIGLEFVGPMDDFAREGLWPNLTLVLDVPVEVGFARLGRRALPSLPSQTSSHQEHAAPQANDRIERRGRDFHERVRHALLELAAPDPTAVVIDGSQPEEAVSQAVRAAVTERLLAGQDD